MIVHGAGPPAPFLSRHSVWLLLAVVLMGLCNLQLLAATWYPIHDNMVRYILFHLFYQEWVYQEDLPHWFAYVNYGTTSYFSQWGGITPLGYLLGGLGAWFKVEQPLLLFKAQLFLEAEFYAVGLTLLSLQLFTTWSARLVVVVSGTLSLIWWFQPNFNFYSFYMVPWILLAMARFFATRHPFWLAVTATMLLLSRIGVFVYILPVLVWTLILISLPLWWRYPQALRAFKNRRLLVYLSALSLLAGVLGWYLVQSLDQITLLKVGRDPSGANTLDSFLHYLRYEDREIVSLAMTDTTAVRPYPDFSLYLGWLPWLLLGYGLLKTRHPWFTGLALVIGVWIWTALGELFATAVFHLLPGMTIYRHISYLFSFVKPLVILAAGFGMEHLHHQLNKPAEDTTSPFGPLAPYAMLVLLLMGLDIGLHPFFWDEPFTSPLAGWNWTASQQTFLLLRVVLYGLAGLALVLRRRLAIPGRHVLLLLLIVGLGDVGSFRLLKSREEMGYLFQQPMDAQWLQAAPRPFVQARSLFPWDVAKQLDLWMRQARPQNGVVYTEMYQLVGEDPCFPLFQYEYLPTPVDQMIRSRGGHPGAFTGYRGKTLIANDQSLLPAGDLPLHVSMGCLTPKLKLFGRWRTAPPDQLVAQFAGMARPDHTLLLPGETMGEFETLAAEDPGIIQVIRHSANTLDLAVTVHGDQPVWLYYADAYHPDWQATVDDQPVPVVRANLGFKAIPVSAGRHRVSWQFGQDATAWLSHLIAWLGWLAGLLALLAMLLGGRLPTGAFPSPNH